MRKDKFRIIQITKADGTREFMPQLKAFWFWHDIYRYPMTLQQARDVISEESGKIEIKREVVN